VHDLLEELWSYAPDVGAADRIGFETAVAEVAANIVQHAAAVEEVDLNLALRAYPIASRPRSTTAASPPTSTCSRPPCRTRWPRADGAWRWRAPPSTSSPTSAVTA
jgi:hypothetical protein